MSVLFTTTIASRGTRSATNRSPRPNGIVASITRHTRSTPPNASVAVALRLVPSALTGLWMPGRVDEHDLHVGPREHPPYLRPRRLRLVGDDRDLRAEDVVEQRRLPDVRTPDQGHEPRPEAHSDELTARAHSSSSSSPGSHSGSSVTFTQRDAAAVDLFDRELPLHVVDRLGRLGHPSQLAEHEPADGVPVVVWDVRCRAARSARRSGRCR